MTQEAPPNQTEPPKNLSAWAPFASRAFTWLWLANTVSALGTWIQNAAASWMMTDLAPDPIMVSLVQAAAQLPFLLLAVPAGALADLVDRRRHLLLTNLFMLVVSALLAVMAVFGLLDALFLLMLTGLLAIGAAFNNPAWAASVPLTVTRPLLSQALVLNAIGFNLARAIGPALGGLLLLIAGAAAAFMANAASFAFVALVLAVFLKFPPVPKTAGLPPEPFRVALRTGLAYAMAEPTVRVALVRSATFFGAASAVWALLPLYVRQVLGLSSGSFGIMMGMIGGGAVIGGLIMPWLQARWSRNNLIMLAGALCGVAMLPLAIVPFAAAVQGALLVFGVGWVIGASSLQATVQLASAPWVRARVMALYQAVFNGAMGVGAILWGWLGAHAGLPGTLLAAGLGGALVAVAMRAMEIPSGIKDPAVPGQIAARAIPVAKELEPLLHSARHRLIIAVTYNVDPRDAEEFRVAMANVRLARYREGAIGWTLSRDVRNTWSWIETFRFKNWHELQRGISRINQTDTEAVSGAWAFHQGAEPPRLTILLRE